MPQRLMVSDDITEVIPAQRHLVRPGASGAVPAHEIKNLLTPIQLSAERFAAISRSCLTRRTRPYSALGGHHRQPGKCRR